MKNEETLVTVNMLSLMSFIIFKLHRIKIHDLKCPKSFSFGQFGDIFVKIQASNIVWFLAVQGSF